MRRVLHTLYEYLALWLGLGLLAVITLSWTLVAIPAYYLLPHKRGVILGRNGITQGFRLYLWCLAAMGACRFDLTELDELRTAGPLILAPNHPCLLDAFFVFSRLSNVVCIMKANILDNVFLGAGARLAGYIRNDSALSMVLQAEKELQGGAHLLVFPEGTRTTRWPVNEFTTGIAHVARRGGVPVQTLIIETTSPYLSKGWPLFRRPAMPIHYRVRLGRRFDAPKNGKAFSAELEAYFREEMQDVPSFLHPDVLAASHPDGSLRKAD